jgi:hypothetical protein
MTAQASDSLRFENHDWAVRSEPLEQHVADLGLTFVPPSTALWRGYLADWEVTADDRLVLTEVTCWVPGDHDRPVERQLIELGGRSLPHHADFVSGSIPIGRGELVQYVHMGHQSRNEIEMILDIVKGHVVAVRRRVDRPLGSPPPLNSLKQNTTPAPELPISDVKSDCPGCTLHFAEDEVPSSWCPQCGVRVHLRCLNSHECSRT